MTSHFCHPQRKAESLANNNMREKPIKPIIGVKPTWWHKSKTEERQWPTGDEIIVLSAAF